MRRTIYLLTIILFGLRASAQDLNTLMTREITYEHFSGCVQVIKDGEVYFERCAGKSDVKNANQLETTFDIGSVSKQFTAAGILSLVHEGKLDLQDPINQHLGNYASDRWDEVTIHHLLTHTSGVPSLFQYGQGLEIIMPTAQPISLNKLVSHFAEGKLLFDPGDEYRYSNSGYILLACIIEETTGKSYGDYLKQIFQQYGLTQTSFGKPDTNYAKPFYGYRSDLVKTGVEFDKSWAIGAGGIYSTVLDLNKWTSIIQSDSFLNRELRSLYVEPHRRRGGDKYYGYGWDINKVSGVISHDGMNFGYVSYLGFHPEKNISIAITTNQSYESMTLTGASAAYVEELQTKIWSILNVENVDILPSIEQNDCITGTYQFEDGYQLTLSKMDTSYVVTGKGDYAPSRKVYHHEIVGNTKRDQAMRAVAAAIKKDKFWGMGSVCDGQMKIAIYTGLFSWGFGQVTEDLGEIKEVVPFQLGERTGLIRITGEQEILDIIVYFNAEDEVQGVFEHGFSDFFSSKGLIAFPVGSNELFLDGFPYGETSAMISVGQDELIFNQEGRQFKAIRVLNP